MLIVLLVSCLPTRADTRPYDLLEFFSGSGRISRMASALGYSCAAIDTVYDCTAPPPKTKKRDRKKYKNVRSAMDLNTSAGFLPLALLLVTCLCHLFLNDSCDDCASLSGPIRLCVSLILDGKFGELVTMWGTCCSTWVSINSGSSGRCAFLPMGNPTRPSVRAANLMVSRFLGANRFYK